MTLIDAAVSDVLVVLPVIDADQGRACLDSALAEDSSFGISAADILVVDNTRDGMTMDPDGTRYYRDPDGHNLGVARSWNVGIDALFESDAEYLVMLSTSLRFGPALHTTWRAQMQTYWDDRIIESEGHSLHLWAVHRSLFERVGRFDTSFFPAYHEEIDWHHRLTLLAGRQMGWPRAWINAMSVGYALHIFGDRHPEFVKVHCPAQPLLDYYAKKWGGPKGEETFDLPFGDKPLDWFEDVPIPELAERYGLEVWW